MKTHIQKLNVMKILSLFIKLAKDKDLINTSLNHGFKLIAGPLLLVLIPFFITNEIQGYWFSFISISALSILADLGFTIIIMQFTAHEFAFLSIENKRIVLKENDNYIHLIKLSALFKFSLNWTKKIIIIAFPIILIIGFAILNSEKNDIIWKTPWIIYALGAAITFFNSVLLSFIEGCDYVAKTQRIRFYNTLINFIILFPLLIIGLNLFSLSIALLISSLITASILFYNFKNIYIQLYKLSKENYYNWVPEFLAFFKKYSISVASGYLAIQIFTPLAFTFYGAIEAGKVGMTMSLTTAIFSISNIWFHSIAPKVNILTSEKKWHTINKLIKERSIFAILTYVFAFIFFFMIFIFSKQLNLTLITSRFLPFIGIFILFMHWLIQLPIYIMAFYLRAHKKEPYLYFSIFGTISIVVLTILVVTIFPSKFIFSGLLTTSIISFPFALKIFYQKKYEWCS